MSFVPAFAPDAKSQWLELEPRFQEMILDKIERLCADPPRREDHVSTIVMEESGIRHFLFVHATVHHASQSIGTVGVGYAKRSKAARPSSAS